MASVTFSHYAYCKIILHAAKYPHCAINGVLLGRHTSKSSTDEVHIVDAFPLFHVSLHLTPMAEIGLLMAEQKASHKDLFVAGYYYANENINDMSADKPCHRIADKVAEHFTNALRVAIDNKEVTYEMSTSPLRVSQYTGGKWRLMDVAEITYEKGLTHSNVMWSLIETEQYRNLVDFDNYLDNVALDIENVPLNKIIDHAFEIYK
ncbi:hypothetical protein KM043_008663 [Ampulex compressa]|nr:hypothetical protein KM043_008663 [Ampulex compressa]